MNAQDALPRPGPRWGTYPERAAPTGAVRSGSVWAGHAPWPQKLAAELAPWMGTGLVMRLHAPWLTEVRHHITGLPEHPQALEQALLTSRHRLRREGFTASAVAQALASVAVAVDRALGRRLSDQQLLAAALLLDQRLVELPTGEGKTLALATAAALGAMAGVPTHVITANDYLAERDALALAPLWEAINVSTGHIRPLSPPEDRRQVYRCDIVYTTAKEVAFDHLRDHLGGSLSSEPVLRGLSLALLDEADSILLDEAVVPLVISAARALAPKDLAQRRALWWQAWQLAGAMQWGEHATAATQGLHASLTPAGREHLGQITKHLSGLWRRTRLRQELIELALTARHVLHVDQHYLLRDGRIELLDTLTGRIAEGRVWSQGLQALIELKEACAPSPPTDTLAQTTFQRFFRRYWRLGGLSGTLTESRAEFRQVYGLSVVTLPARQTSARADGLPRIFHQAHDRWQAVVPRVKALRERGQPVLIGTDSVLDSETLSAVLSEAGVAHVVLNARHHQQEAAIIKQAGRSGAITIATRMAGRGTDILPDEAALRAGGLHVIHCQRNESGRMDRQLLGRTARIGQPGSADRWICAGISDDRQTRPDPMLPPCSASAFGSWPWTSPWMVMWFGRVDQWMAQQRQAAIRRHLLEREQQWESQHHPRQRP
jgi:preprotein translocase subunit SecA